MNPSTLSLQKSSLSVFQLESNNMTDKIPVVVGDTESSPEVLGLGDQVEQRIVEINTDTLKRSLGKLTGQLDSLFQDIKAAGGFKLNQVEVSLEISTEGGVALIGTAKAGAHGATSLTFSRG